MFGYVFLAKIIIFCKIGLFVARFSIRIYQFLPNETNLNGFVT